MKNIFTIIFALLLSLGVYAQEQDTMYVHKGKYTYEFAAKEVDSISFSITQSLVSVESVSINPTSISLSVSETKTLSANILPASATNKDVVWRSNNNAVATVKNGVITAVSEGEATIIVVTNDGNHTAICEVIVYDLPKRGDGPYILYDANGVATVYTFDSNLTMYTETYPHRDSIGTLPVWSQLGNYFFTVDLQDNITTPPPARYELPEKIFTLSDPHGSIIPFVRVLQGNDVIDQELNWTFGNGHLMIPGDVMDRGDDQIAIYWLIYKLQTQARQAGGAVHFLFGNHEMMVMQNDLRYVNAKYITVATKMGTTYDKLWNNQTEFGRWLQACNTIEVLGDILFVHAGIGPQMANIPITIEQINDTVRKYIKLPSSAASASPRAALIMGSNGPLWYRSLVENTLYESVVEELVDQYNVDLFVLGHTRVNELTELYNGKVICLDVTNTRDYNMQHGLSLAAAITPTTKWPVNVSGNPLAFIVVPPPPPPPPPVITPENVSTFEQDPAVEALAAFLNGGTANYELTLMSSQLEGWRQSYSTQFPSFTGYTIQMPRGTYQLSVVANYDSGAKWYRGPSDPLPAQNAIVAMTGEGNNPLCDVTFSIPRSSVSSGTAPPTGYNGSSTGAITFFNFMQNTTGYTILQDYHTFWFRSKADPNDWFVFVRQ